MFHLSFLSVVACFNDGTLSKCIITRFFAICTSYMNIWLLENSWTYWVSIFITNESSMIRWINEMWQMDTFMNAVHAMMNLLIFWPTQMMSNYCYVGYHKKKLTVVETLTLTLTIAIFVTLATFASFASLTMGLGHSWE